MLRIIQGNILGSDAGAIVLTMDGAHQGLEGNIARAFAQRWPEAFAVVEAHVPYPLPLGKGFAVHLEEECPFGWVIVASTLHHVDSLDDEAKVAVVRRAMINVLTCAALQRMTSVAAAVMTGGWRLSLSDAVAAMLDGYAAVAPQCPGVTLNIHVLDSADASTIRSVAQRLKIVIDR